MNFKCTTKYLLAYGIGLALIAGALFLFIGAQEPVSAVPARVASPVSPEMAMRDHTFPLVRIGRTEIIVEIATSSAAVQNGLSGRISLNVDRGMLFIFNRADRYRFWMPDMRFPIDIIWIDNGQVVDADENVSPEFDPLHPIFYTPANPVRYVLEVNAGFMKRKNIRIGDPVTLHRIR